MDKMILGIIIFALFSCKEDKKNYAVGGKRDSLVSNYFKLIDSLNALDSLEPQTRMLLAYTENDTNYMKAVINDLQVSYSESRAHFQTNRRLEPAGVTTYGFEEAYRFQYSAAFCDQSVDITIGKKGDSVLLYGYRYTWIFGTDSCISVDSTKAFLSYDQSQNLSKSLTRTDLWGLKASAGNVGFDGSNLFVTAYEKAVNARRSRYTKIHRWSPQKTALGECFKLALELSKFQIACFRE
ncbi:MAG: hypothetical protein EOP04_30440 [Proteobacteria bacterium]|nr:MAG: hypothetical protein EOP04_30440 [Pseudomonadota bacterium]